MTYSKSIMYAFFLYINIRFKKFKNSRYLNSSKIMYEISILF